MRLKIKNFRKGTSFYKGFNGKYNNTILKDEKYFFLTANQNAVNAYMRLNTVGPNVTPFYCSYVLQRSIKLLVLDDETIRDLYEEVAKTQTNKSLIKFAFGKGTKNEKLEILKNLSPSHFEHYKGLVTNKSRISLHEIDKRFCKFLCLFLKVNNLDGYYFEGKDEFHQEIMLCDASKGLLFSKCKYTHNPTGARKIQPRYTIQKFSTNIVTPPKKKVSRSLVGSIVDYFSIKK